MNLFNRNNENGSAATAPNPARLTVRPRYQTRETDDAYVITAYLPGVDRSALETTVHGENLTIAARRSPALPESWTPVHRESTDADYRLVLELDHRVNRDGIKAELTQGVLTLTVPKAETVKPRRIEIQG